MVRVRVRGWGMYYVYVHLLYASTRICVFSSYKMVIYNTADTTACVRNYCSNNNKRKMCVYTGMDYFVPTIDIWCLEQQSEKSKQILPDAKANVMDF